MWRPSPGAEDFLARRAATLVFVTHDRMFFAEAVHRILEIDRGRLFDWSCDYDTFLSRKEDALAAEEKQNALFDKRLAEEEVWIRQGIRARRTRNEGRVRALEQMRRDRSERRATTAKVNLAIQEGQRSGVLVAEADSVSFAYGERPVFRDFSTSIMRGDKIGIMGPNGAGKTTLLAFCWGNCNRRPARSAWEPTCKIAYFDQLRRQLNDETSVQENVGDGYDTRADERRHAHIIGYLQDFLFRPGARPDAGSLSVGRRTQSRAVGQAVRQTGECHRAGRTDQ